MKNNRPNRRGGAVIIIVILVVLAGIAAGATYGYKYNDGKELQTKQDALWTEAFTLFGQKQPEAAYLKLTEARETFTDNLDFYRNTATGTYLSKAEITDAMVLICQSEAYDVLFKLESATDWLTKAKNEISNVKDAETKETFTNFISRAESANQFVETLNTYKNQENLEPEKYQQLVKDSLKVGGQALSENDYDYTIFEIRFLIACGKAFNEPILVNEARMQLFDITKESGEDEKTKLLWSILRN